MKRLWTKHVMQFDELTGGYVTDWNESEWEWVADFPETCCGGASSQEQQIQAQQQQAQEQYYSEATQYFQEEQGVLSNLQTSLQPILNGGPNQLGFSSGELSNLNANAINTTASNYRNAAVTAGENAGAAQGNTYAPSGGQQELQGAITSAGAQQASSEENQIMEADYQTGRANYWSAESALGNVAGLYGSGASSLANTEVNAGSSAFNMASTIQQQDNQALAGDIMGALSIGSMALGGFGNMDFSGGSTGGENALNFLQGAGF